MATGSEPRENLAATSSWRRTEGIPSTISARVLYSKGACGARAERARATPEARIEAASKRSKPANSSRLLLPALLCSLGDVTGDGRTELLLTASTYDANGHRRSGGAWLVGGDLMDLGGDAPAAHTIEGALTDCVRLVQPLAAAWRASAAI